MTLAAPRAIWFKAQATQSVAQATQSVALGTPLATRLTMLAGAHGNKKEGGRDFPAALRLFIEG